MRYTERQLEAISHREGNLLILACAGSGKTEVISRRIAALVKEKTPRSQIAAFTFTQRAADELKSRIRKHLELLMPEDPSIGDMYVGTIHSFCLQLLRDIDPQYRKYEVMDEARQAALIMSNFHHFEDTDRGIGLQLLRSRTRGGHYWETVKTFLTTLNVIYQSGLDHDAINDLTLRSAITRYQKIAYGDPNFFFDFNEIISLLLRRLRNDCEELARVRSRFRYIVVDEYQDVDEQQEQLIQLLSNDGRSVYVTAVGDDDQAIYGWRGARIENILTFSARYPAVKEVKLEYNFRSTHAIVEIANGAIGTLPPGRRIQKNMQARHWANETESYPSETLAEYGDIQVREFGSEEEEAEWVAERVDKLRGTIISENDGSRRPMDWADIAILLRSVRSAGQLFATKLLERGVPVVVRGTGGLFNHKEIRLVQASFCLLARKPFLLREDDDVVQMEELETRDFVRKTIQDLRLKDLMPTADEDSFLRWIAAQKELLDKRNLAREERSGLSRRIYPQHIFQDMLCALGAADGRTPWPQGVLYNLGRFSSLITQFEAVHQWVSPKDLGALCFFLGSWAAGQVDEGGLTETVTLNAVQIMTVHAAKGLEWPVVFLPRVSSSNFPSSLRNRGPETFLSPGVFNNRAYSVGDDGERRLWYVALTRCRKFLHVTSPRRPRKKPTEFFEDIKHDRVQRRGDILPGEKGQPTPPANVDLLPTTHTALSYFWRCPFEYQLRELMGFGPGVRESYGYGQQIHNILAEIHKLAATGNSPSIEEVDALIDKRFHLRYTKDGENQKPLTALRRSARDAILRYLNAYPNYSQYVLEAEKPFEFVDHESGALISGSIDLLERVESTPEGDKRVPVAIVDFKSHSFKDLDSYNRTRGDVETQLRLYSIAVSKALSFEANRARAHLLSPRGPSAHLQEQGVRELIEIDISPQLLAEVQERVRTGVSEIKRSVKQQNFQLLGCRVGACKTCDYRRFCPGYREWDRTDKNTPRPGSLEDDKAREIAFVMEDVDAGSEAQ
jgi:DNA helicase-2/ATP-dependent DNA helicase PcrA